MTRPLAFVLTALLSLCSAGSTLAADWTATAFPVRSHDFGTVAVAAKTEFAFEVFNPLGNTMHIRSVRASCGCTTPIVQNEYIAPNQTGFIVARFNTDTFKGQRGATLTVVIDKPFYSEVQLKVNGYIRSDMVLFPGSIDFSRLNQGDAVSKATKVYYAGRSDWQIVDVRSNKPWLMPVFKESSRVGGSVQYDLSVDIREDAPTGYFQDELVIVTNDRTMPNVPVRVSGQVESGLSISPQAVALGSIKTGEAISRKLVLVGREPFKIDSIVADGWELNYEPTTEAKKMHMVDLSFTYTGDGAGPKKATFAIKTAGDSSVVAKGLVTAEIRGQ